MRIILSCCIVLIVPLKNATVEFSFIVIPILNSPCLQTSLSVSHVQRGTLRAAALVFGYGEFKIEITIFLWFSEKF